MPIYEYQCAACGHKFETLQKFSDAPLTECPECHKSSLEKLISASGFQLKGTGWYVTDYSAKGKKSQSDEGKASGSETKSTDSGDKSGGSSSTSSSG